MLVTLCTRYNACYTVYTIQCLLHCVHDTVLVTLCIRYNACHTVYTIQCLLHCVHDTMLVTLCTRYNARQTQFALCVLDITLFTLYMCAFCRHNYRHRMSDLTRHLWMFDCTQISRKRKVFVMRSFGAVTWCQIWQVIFECFIARRFPESAKYL